MNCTHCGKPGSKLVPVEYEDDDGKPITLSMHEDCIWPWKKSQYTAMSESIYHPTSDQLKSFGSRIAKRSPVSSGAVLKPLIFLPEEE